MPATQAPYSQYFDKNGQPLDAGYVWFGLPNENPKTSPVNVYWDADLTQPASQPIRTLAGYLARNGSPAQVFTDGAYSQIVENKRFEMVYYAANSADYSDLPIRVAVITATDGQTLVNLPFAYTRGNNSLAIYLNGILWIKDKDYIETSTTSVTMICPLKVGPGGADEVTAIGGRLINAASAIDAVSAAGLAAGSGAGLVGYDPSLTFPAGTVGERLQQTTYTVDAITAIDATALGLVDGVVVFAKGRDTSEDGGGGTGIFMTSAPIPADGGRVIAVTGGFFVHEGYNALRCIPVGWYGVKCDAATDDLAAWNRFIAAGVRGQMPLGRSMVSAEIAWGNNARLEGSGFAFWQFAVNAPAVGECSEIYYTGAAGATTCVVRQSKVAVGVLPVFQPDESQTLIDAGICNVLINGGGNAAFGLYVARTSQNHECWNVAVTGTTRRGFFFGEYFTQSVGGFLIALFNDGSGGSFGEDLFGWSTGNIVNAVQCQTLLAYKNGLAATYDDVTAPTDGVGWILNWNRTCEVANMVCELNYGAGYYASPRSGPTKIHELYMEDNCHYDPVTDGASASNTAFALGQAELPWGMVGYNRRPVSAGDTLMHHVGQLLGATPGSRLQYIQLTGDATAGVVDEPTEPWLFGDTWGIGGIRADFYKWGFVGVPQRALTDSNPSNNDILRCLPSYGTPEQITGSVTTLYCGNAVSGTKSGRDGSNLMLLADALECARVCKGVTVIDVSAMTSAASAATSRVINGRGYTRRMSIVGGTTGRLNFATGDNIAATIQNWASELTISAMLVMDRLVIVDSRVKLLDDPILRSGANTGVTGALVCDNSDVQVAGTSVINVSTSTAATKVGVTVRGGAQLSFDNAAAGTFGSYTAGNAIHFDQGGGTVRVSLTTATATWAAAANVVRNTGGGGGMILAPNGLNP